MTSAISIKDRLKKQVVAGGKTFQEALTAYGLEQTVYRLSVSEYVERFTLKGGIFLYALFEGEFARATRDIDLLARNMPNNVENMKKVFENIFSIECDDALRYDLNTLDVTDITEFKEYHGVNVSIMAYLDRTEIPVSIDIGFGDIIYPDRVKMEFPVLLDMEVPEIYAYSISSVISEKFEAIVSLVFFKIIHAFFLINPDLPPTISPYSHKHSYPDKPFPVQYQFPRCSMLSPRETKPGS